MAYLVREYRARFVWTIICILMFAPIALAAMSPLLAWRDPVYIASGFAGITALSLLLLQPLLSARLLPGASARVSRSLHRTIGAFLVILVCGHVIGLWLTSPPDVVDALLFRSPTPFSAWGVIAMWALFATAAIGIFRRKITLRPQTWQRVHTLFAAIVVAGSVVHALRVDGTMEITSKTALCLGVCIAAALAILRLRQRSLPRQ